MTYQSSTFYIVAIVLVTIVGTGFAWSYHTIVRQSVSTNAALIHQPTVLGAATGETTVTPLASEMPNHMRPSDVNRLFLEFCHRPARLTEMDAWTNHAPAALTSSFADIPNCL